MNHLLRDLAPITDAGWRMIDEEARQRLRPALGARRLVDFSGPLGWDHAARNLGRTTSLQTPYDGVTARSRQVLPAVELRADFTVSRRELEDVDRGADDIDLDDLDAAARRIATAENLAVLRGWGDVVPGIGEAATLPPVALGPDAQGFPRAVARAVEALLDAGVEGPYGLALGVEQHRIVIETTEHGGYPLLEHLREITSGPVVRVAGLEGGVLVSQRGGDFLFEAGQDLSIGYADHDADTVWLYLQESFTFHVATPDAAVLLTA